MRPGSLTEEDMVLPSSVLPRAAQYDRLSVKDVKSEHHFPLQEILLNRLGTGEQFLWCRCKTDRFQAETVASQRWTTHHGTFGQYRTVKILPELLCISMSPKCMNVSIPR